MPSSWNSPNVWNIFESVPGSLVCSSSAWWWNLRCKCESERITVSNWCQSQDWRRQHGRPASARLGAGSPCCVREAFGIASPLIRPLALAPCTMHLVFKPHDSKERRTCTQLNLYTTIPLVSLVMFCSRIFRLTSKIWPNDWVLDSQLVLLPPSFSCPGVYLQGQI